MTFLIIYLVSVLLNLFVFIPISFKYIDVQRINAGDISSIIAISFFSIFIPVIVVCKIVSDKFPLHLSYRISNFLIGFGTLNESCKDSYWIFVLG